MHKIKYQFLLCYAVLGCAIPYAPIYLQERGLSDAQIGLVMSLGGVSVLLMPVLTALLTDLKLAHRVLIGAISLGQAVALSLLFASYSLWALMATYLLYTLMVAPMTTLLDGLVFSVRSERERRGLPVTPYHRIRAVGTFGFILPAFLLYWIIDPEKSVGPAILLGGLIALLAAGYACVLPNTRGPLGEPGAPIEVPDPHPPARQGRHVPTLLALKRMLQPDIALFCVAMWLSQLAFSTYYAFYPIYLSRVIGVEDQWQGLISAIGVVMEIGYLIAFGWLLKKLGLKWLAAAGLFCVTLRMALLAFAPNMAVAVGTQMLHGLAVVGTFVTPPLYLNHRAKPEYRNSIQGLYAVFVFGTGMITGNILSGQIAEHAQGGVLTAFTVTALIAGAATLMFVLFFRDRSETRLEP